MPPRTHRKPLGLKMHQNPSSHLSHPTSTVTCCHTIPSLFVIFTQLLAIPLKSIRIHQHSPSSKSHKKLEQTDRHNFLDLPDIRRYKQNNPTPGVGISYYPSSIIGTIYSSEILNYYDGTSATDTECSASDPSVWVRSSCKCGIRSSGFSVVYAI